MLPTLPPLQPKQHPTFSPATIPTNISITSVTPTTLPAYRRLITLLLPIRYPDKFYKDSIANPTPSSLALCAVWHDLSSSRKRKIESLEGSAPNDPVTTEPKVIGGIQCRIEPIPTVPSNSTPTPPQFALYVQTLATLSPYRSLGVASALLDAIVTAALQYHSSASGHVVEVYAHVWEANEDALEWYVKRGFQIEQGVVEGYYRKLRPSGARIVKRRLGVGDWLRVKDAQKVDHIMTNEESGRMDAGTTRHEMANG